MIINKQIKKKKVPSAHFLIASIHHHDISHLCPRHNTPSTDLVVGVTSEESLAVSAPGQGNTLGLTALLALLDVLGLELIDLALLLEVEDGDAGGGGSAEPVTVGGKDEGVDLIAGVERVEVLGLVKVPEHGGTVLATGGAERAVGGDGDGVDVTGVTNVVGLETAGSELPDLFMSLVFLFRKFRIEKNSNDKEFLRHVVIFVPWPKGSEVANTYICKHLWNSSERKKKKRARNVP